MLIAIDPGPATSGMVRLDDSVWPPRVVRSWRAATMDDIYLACRVLQADDWVVVEGLTCYGKVIGASTIETAMAVGEVKSIVLLTIPAAPRVGFTTITRPEIGRALCPFSGSGTPTGSQMAEAIRDIYRKAGRATGGGADPTRGTKAQPGPLFGLSLSQHEGSALAVGLAWMVLERDGGVR